MTLPANVRVNVKVSFPTLVVGTGLIAITKANGIWTVGWSMLGLATFKAAQIPNPSIKLVLLQDSLSGALNTMALSDLHDLMAEPVAKLINATGNVTIADNDDTDQFEINNTSAGPIDVYLPSVPARSKPIMITDVGGNAATYGITILPKLASGQTIMTGASYTIDSNGGGITLTPNSAMTGYK